MKQPIFNGHTWIVVIIAILSLLAIGGGSEYAMTYIYGRTSDSTGKTFEMLGMASVPLQVVYGIIKIVDRLTYLPNTMKKGVE